MDRYPVHVVFARGLLPLPAVVRNVNFIHELTKLPTSVYLAFGVLLGDNSTHCFPGLGLRHLFDQTKNPTFAPAIDPPHADPATTLLLDTSRLVPFAHSISPMRVYRHPVLAMLVS